MLWYREKDFEWFPFFECRKRRKLSHLIWWQFKNRRQILLVMQKCAKSFDFFLPACLGGAWQWVRQAIFFFRNKTSVKILFFPIFFLVFERGNSGSRMMTMPDFSVVKTTHKTLLLFSPLFVWQANLYFWGVKLIYNRGLAADWPKNYPPKTSEKKVDSERKMSLSLFFPNRCILSLNRK